MATQDPITRLNAALQGRYRIGRQLGEGGMATVYLADDLRHERKVALKVLKPELAAVVGAERFLAEIKTTANLQHPHILPLFDSGEAGGFLFYVMPYVEGESLRDRLDREKQLPVEEAVRIATEVADALTHAHVKGVIHRDVKPANILLLDEHVQVADFGIALAVGKAGGERLTETGLSMGTPYYMSPEQATGDLTVGPTADLYALGCVLYEMLVGEPPHTGSSAQAVLGKILTVDPTPPSELRRSVPSHVEAVILSALQKLPADRLQSASEFSSFLRDPTRVPLLKGPTGSHSARRWSRVGWDTAAWIAVGAAAAAGIMTVGSRGARDAPPVRELTIDLPVDAPMPLTGSAWQDIRSLDLAPDGSFIVFEGTDSAGVRLYQRSLRDGEVEPVSGSEGGYYPFISPDGLWVAFFVGDQLKKASLAGAGGVLTLGTLGESPFGATWLSEEEILVSELGTLVRFSAAAASERDVLGTCSEPFNCWQPQPLPGGDLLLVSGYTSVGVYSLSTGGWNRLVGDVRAPGARYVDPGYLLYFHEPGRLFARRFDVETLSLGPPVPVLSGLRHYVEGELALSRGGDLVFARGAPTFFGHLTWKWKDGREERLLFEPQSFGVFTLSPDGLHLAATVYQPGAEIWLYDLRRGESRRISDERHSEHPVWSPDGRQVAWGLWNNEDEPPILARPVDGGEIRTLLPRAGAPYSWSPSGLITFIRAEGGNNNDIWIGDVTTGETEEFFATPGVDDSPAFSPDGSAIAYWSDVEGENWEVYVEPFPPDGRRRKLSRGRGYFPRWSRDGRTLYYQGGESGRLFYSVDLSAGIDAPGEPELMFEGPYMRGPGHSFDVAPDEERFLVVKLGDSREVIESLTWVQNFRVRIEEALRAAGG